MRRLAIILLAACDPGEPPRGCRATDLHRIEVDPGWCSTTPDGNGGFYTYCEPPREYDICLAVMQRWTVRRYEAVTVPRLPERR